MDSIFECNPEDAYHLPDNTILFFGPTEPTLPPYCPPVFQTTESAVFEYFENQNIEQMMEYFVTLLCIHLPEDPFDYIEEMCEKMIKSRTHENEFEELDPLFEPAHILAMFSIFDKQQRKYVTVQQYKSAMEMLGITRYNPQPVGFVQNIITEEVFFDEVTKALDLRVKSFIG